MMKERFFLYFLLLCIVPFEVNAESAKWTISPRYSNIIDFGKGLYKVKSGNKFGVLDKSGKEVVPITADSITNPSEGYSLILKGEDDKLRLTAIMNAYGVLTKVNESWYVDEFPFFSDGLLPVCTKKGKYGFIDVNGKVCIDFAYGSVHPFCEGKAAVSKGKGIAGTALKLLGIKKKEKVFYIDKSGNVLDLASDIGDIYLATSFSDDEALVINMNDKRFVINKEGKALRIESPTTILDFNDKYALRKKGEEESQGVNDHIGNGPKPYNEEGYYGYRYNGQVVLPPQFIYAEPFNDGYAIAIAPTGYGLLQLINADIQYRWEKGTEDAPDKDMKSLNWVMKMPDEWGNGIFEMRCKSGNGVETKAQGEKDGSSWNFSFVVPSGNNVYSLVGKDSNGELTLWSSSSNVKSESTSKSGVTTSGKANKVKKVKKERKRRKANPLGNSHRKQRNTMKIRLLLSLVLFSLLDNASAFGTMTDKITLTDGTILEGYICLQCPEEGFKIHTERSIRTISVDDIENFTSKNVKLKSLSTEWKECADEYPECVISANGIDYIALASFNVNDSTYDRIENVMVLENGGHIKYLDLNTEEVTVKYSDVAKICPKETSTDILSGFIDEIELASGKVIKGKVIETIPGESIKIRTDKGGVELWSMDRIKAKRKLKKNDKQSEVEQAQILEKVKLMNGRSVEGVIIEQIYGDENHSSRIIMATVNGVKESIENNDVKEISYKENPNYAPMHKLHIGDDEVYAYEKKLDKANVSVKKNIIKASSVNKNYISKRLTNGELTIQTKDNDANEQLLLLPITQEESNGIVAIDSRTVFTDEIRVAEKGTDDGITNWTFTLRKNVSTYAIYLPQIETIYILYISQ